MKQLMTRWVFAVSVLGAAATAQAQGLQRAATVLQAVQAQAMVIIPIIAVLSLIVLAVLWATRVIRFVSLVQWGAGVILVGCAGQLVSMLMS